MLTRPHSASFLRTRITYLRCSPARSRWPSSLHAVIPLYTARHRDPRGSWPFTGHTPTTRSALADSAYTARHPRGSGPVTGHPATSRSARADSSTCGPLGSGQLGSAPRSHPCSAQATGIPAEHMAQADSDPSVQSRHMTLTTTTPPGPGYIPPARVHTPSGTSPIVQMSQDADPAGNRSSSLRLPRQGLRWSTSQALRSADPGAQSHRA